MNIGILKEDPRRERRIALTPAGVQTLISEGAKVFIEKDAGTEAHFPDQKYEEVGAKIVYNCDEIFGRSDLILKVTTPTETELEQMLDSQILFSALHLAVAKPKILDYLLKKNICAVGIELLEDSKGRMPVLHSMSEIAGQMSIQVAARYLESTNHGRGILLGGLTAVAPASIVILGTGTVAQVAARMALGEGAQVIVLGRDLEKLRSIEQRFDYRVITGLVNKYNLQKFLKFADVLIGAVLIKGEKTPHIVTESMVKLMKPGAVIIDVSIDQGGCIETSRPTTLENPVYVLHNVIHFCVPNMAANVPRTGTYALTNSLTSYLIDIVNNGIENAIKLNVGLSKGICTYKSYCTQLAVAKSLGVEYTDIKNLI